MIFRIVCKCRKRAPDGESIEKATKNAEEEGFEAHRSGPKNQVIWFCKDCAREIKNDSSN